MTLCVRCATSRHWCLWPVMGLSPQLWASALLWHHWWISLVDLTGDPLVQSLRGRPTVHHSMMLSTNCTLRSRPTGHHCMMLNKDCMLRNRPTGRHCMVLSTGCMLTELPGMQVAAGYVLHIGQANGAFTVGDKVVCQRDQQRRQRILPNHTFTHVLNYALREVLGDDVHQKGSIVLPDKLRSATHCCCWDRQHGLPFVLPM